MQSLRIGLNLVLKFGAHLPITMKRIVETPPVFTNQALSVCPASAWSDTPCQRTSYSPPLDAKTVKNSTQVPLTAVENYLATPAFS